MMTKLSFWVNYSFKAILYTSILSLFGSLPLSGFATAEWYAQPIWHIFTPDAFPAVTSPWECTNSCKLSARTHSLILTNIHSLRPISFVQFIYTVCLWIVGETGVPWGNPRRHWDMHKEHANSTQKGILAQLGPSCCEATVQPTEPPPLYTSILFYVNKLKTKH